MGEGAEGRGWSVGAEAACEARSCSCSAMCRWSLKGKQLAGLFCRSEAENAVETVEETVEPARSVILIACVHGLSYQVNRSPARGFSGVRQLNLSCRSTRHVVIFVQYIHCIG